MIFKSAHHFSNELLTMGRSAAGMLTFLVAVVLCQTSLAQNKEGAMICNVADLKTLALSINNEQEREKSVTDWLSRFGKTCSVEQIGLIKINLAPWLGTANTPRINRSIESLIAGKNSAQKNYDADVSGFEKTNENSNGAQYPGEKISTRR